MKAQFIGCENGSRKDIEKDIIRVALEIAQEERMRSQDSANSHLKLSDLPRYEKTENTFQKAFIALQCNCVLCATLLEIKVTANEENIEVKEEAFCPQCNIRMRSKSHIVQ